MGECVFAQNIARREEIMAERETLETAQADPARLLSRGTAQLQQ